jgi:hypothetical protein
MAEQRANAFPEHAGGDQFRGVGRALRTEEPGFAQPGIARDCVAKQVGPELEIPGVYQRLHEQQRVRCRLVLVQGLGGLHHPLRLPPS